MIVSIASVTTFLAVYASVLATLSGGVQIFKTFKEMADARPKSLKRQRQEAERLLTAHATIRRSVNLGSQATQDFETLHPALPCRLVPLGEVRREIPGQPGALHRPEWLASFMNNTDIQAQDRIVIDHHVYCVIAVTGRATDEVTRDAKVFEINEPFHDREG